MKTTIHILISFMLVSALAACGTSVKDLQGVQPSGTAFEQALFEGYAERSRIERAEQHFTASSVFADRALAVANGQTVLPEAIGNRDLPEAAVPEMTAARDRLMAALDKTAREKIPDQAARAQVMFDCWMEEQEEDLQPGDIAACRAGFEDAMAAIDAAFAQPMAVEAPPPPPAPAPPAPLPGPYLVFFDHDSSEITLEAERIISEASWGIESSGAVRAIVTGHTDRSGSADYNMALSERRADAVSAALQEAGIAVEMIGVSFAGETLNLLPTEDGVREPQNRRAEIMLER